MEPMREPLCSAVALTEVTKRVEWGRGERRVRVQVEVRMCIYICVYFFFQHGGKVFLGRGKEGWGERDTYGSVIDKTGGWRIGVAVFIVVVVIIIASMVGVFGWTKFWGWDLDVKRGESFAKTGDRRNCASVGLES